ncbi:MAG: TolC family protein [Gemmatimonadales bacterium]
MRAAAHFVVVALVVPSLISAQESQRLTLGDAARMAADNSTPVLEAQARAEAAEARVGVTTAGLLPSVDADLMQTGRTFNTASFGLDFPTPPGQPPLFDPDGEVVGPVRGVDLRARADIPLVDLGAWRRRRTARSNVAAARQDVEAASEAAALTAARAYLANLRAQADIAARQEDLALAEELLVVARGLVESGVGVAIDQTRAEAQVATIRAQLVSVEHRAAAAELALRRALEIDDGTTIDFADDLTSMPTSTDLTQDEAIALALERRRDLSAALARETAAEDAVSATRAGRLPRLTAAIDEGFYGRRYGNLLNTYSWSVRLTVPLFDGLERSSLLREEESRVREIGYRLEDLREDIVFQVRRSLLDLEAAQELAAAAEERQRLAELEVEQENERVRAGVAGTADAVRAAMRLNEARTARLDALSALQESRVGLAAATGTVVELP